MKRLTNTTHYLTDHATRNTQPASRITYHASRITYHLKEHSHDHLL